MSEFEDNVKAGVETGQVSLTGARNLPLNHKVSAALLKSPGIGVGSVIEFSGQAEVTSFKLDGDKIVWSARVGPFEASG